ncbi:MAG: sialate O-acetylesterase, partial [Verrucomicrobiota bacterium]|nr:sialate O-acetylesterase [Verrucomicrobiota bacterium]
MKSHTTSKYFVFLVFLALLSSAFATLADVTLPRILGSGLVLQRDLPVPIWGWANADEKISVTFAGQTK